MINITKIVKDVIKITKPKKETERVWMYVDKDILKWVYKKINEKVFADVNHCFEYLVYQEMKKGKK